MCGIFGVLAENCPTKGQENFLFDAMQTGQVRGLHGSGLFTVARDMEVLRCSLAVPGTAFLADPRSENVRKSVARARLVVGHNRYTTSGDNVDEHCHPFQFGTVVGVHNGMIPEAVLNRIDPDRSHDVDSARVFAALSRAEDPLSVLEKINGGAYCLVWSDTRTKSLYVARNEVRPLYLAETSSGLFFASELGMLTWLLGRHGFGGKDPLKISAPDKLTLYQIPLNSPKGITASPYHTRHSVISSVNPHWLHATSGGRSFDDDEDDYMASTVAAPYVPVNRNGPYSGYPNRLRYKVYYTLATMKYDFPLMEESINDTLGLMALVQGHSYHRQYAWMCVVGTGKNMHNDEVAYGFLCHADGTTILYNTLVSLRLSTAADRKAMEDLLQRNDGAARFEDQQFPMMQVRVDSYVLRPSGEIILQAIPSTELGAPLFPDLDSVEYLCGLDELGPPWAEEIISADYMKNSSEEAIMDEWTMLKSDGPRIF